MNNQSKKIRSYKFSGREKTTDDYIFYIGTIKQASDYELSVEFIINYIKRTFTRGNDISESLRTLTEFNTKQWRPTLQISTSNILEDKLREDKQYKFEYKAELGKAIKRSREYKENLCIFVLSYGRNAQNQCKINWHQGATESDIFNNPINLLKEIKEHSLNFQDTYYKMLIISDALKS